MTSFTLREAQPERDAAAYAAIYAPRGWHDVSWQLEPAPAAPRTPLEPPPPQ